MLLHLMRAEGRSIFQVVDLCVAPSSWHCFPTLFPTLVKSPGLPHTAGGTGRLQKARPLALATEHHHAYTDGVHCPCGRCWQRDLVVTFAGGYLELTTIASGAFPGVV